MIKLKKYKKIITFSTVFVFLLLFHFLGALRPVENFLLTIVKPVSGRLYSLGRSSNNSYTDRQNQADLPAQLDVLRSQVAALTVANANCQEISTENAKLREQAKFLNEHNFRAVTASVIAQEGAIGAGEASQDLVINRGAKDNLRVGLAIIEPNGTIIGKITALKDNTANICLVTSPGCKLAAAIENQNQTPGIADGDLGLTVKMEYIPQTDKISAGDIVITSGLGGNIPRGLVIGRVKEVRNESNAVWQDATIEPLVDFNNLTLVSVIIP
jgi:rod shape-determining protein MreC